MTLDGFFPGTGMPDPGWWEALWPEPARVLADVGLKPGMSVVDLCSGDGWFTLQIAKVAKHVTAIDIDGVLLETARARLREANVSNCAFVEADAFDMARCVGEPVDYVFLGNALHGVPDKVRLAGAVHDVLKPGGLFAVVSWHDRPREHTHVLGVPRGPATELRMSPRATISAVEPGGLRHLFTTEVSPHHYGSVFERLAD